MPDDEKKSTPLKTIMDFFGLKSNQKMTEFANEYKALSDKDKLQLVEGIESGLFNY